MKLRRSVLCNHQSIILSIHERLLQPSKSEEEKTERMKKRSERRKHCALAVVRRNQKFSPLRNPLIPGDAGQPKFNQLEMVTSPTGQLGEDRCTQFRVIVVTDP